MKTAKTIISSPSAEDELDQLVDAHIESEVRPLTFRADHHGQRLDRALTDLVPEFSRSYLQQLIELGFVKLGGKIAQKPAQKIKAFEFGCIELRPTPQSQAFKAETIALEVVYQDAYVLVINKPAGLVVHPAPGHWSGTLMNALLGMDAQAFNLPRAGIVHRLDKDTSGLMVVARTRVVMDALVKAIAERAVKRQYLALAHGAWRGASHLAVDAPVGRDPNNRLRMAVVDLRVHAGKPALTEFEFLADCEQGCLVRCTLQTGRTHQIRVHMASLKHPLVSDVLYGGALAAGMQRQALHAFHLSFNHPVTGKIMKFVSPLPMDMLVGLDVWGVKYNSGSL